MTGALAYKSNRLFIEDVDVADLAKEIETPFYVYSSAAIEGAYQRLKSALSHPHVRIFYAVKACSNIAVLKLLGAQGAGMDIVSIGEMKRCEAAGVAPGNIVFSGVGKSREEIAYALHKGIYQFNVESLPELEAIANVAEELKVTAPVALRVNPDIDAGAHKKIATGNEENKFGINWDQVEAVYDKACRMDSIQPVGLSVHIGSQIMEVEPFRRASKRVADMVKRLRAKSQPVERVSLGGGFGIPYQGGAFPLQEFGELVTEFADKLQCHVEVEPGRFLVGEAGMLVTRVIYVKHGTAKNFLIVDAAMNDLIRPTLYEAYHPIGKVIQEGAAQMTYDIVGPVCETGDYFAHDRKMEGCKEGDLITIFCAGAYGAVMAGTYNSRALIAEVLVKDDKFSTIRTPLTIEKQLAWETIPGWL
jgi:diaminopimelate decarboxylase